MQSPSTERAIARLLAKSGGSLWKIAGIAALVLALLFALSWLFLPSDSSGAFSPWERLTGETPSAKVDAYVEAVARGDETAALARWELPTWNLPNERTDALRARRLETTRALITAGMRSEVTIRSAEWWRTCCEPGVIHSAADAGGARLTVRLTDRNGATHVYTFDVFNRDGAYWGAAMDFPARHWVVRDVYPVGQLPLFWLWVDLGRQG
ncbi:MAG TPA: hypothetical protein VFZ25_16725 [Chloroflexota bacterium]|nr:hypothetical protein [Chloroflexota bacterium]